MVSGRKYIVTKRIKLHTKPLRTAVITEQGIFEKETATRYVFDNFSVNKSTVIKIKPVITK